VDRVSAAEDAIRNFDFDDYGMDDVDPTSEYAEWVPDLATKIEAAVRVQVAEEISAALQRLREDGETDMRQAIAVAESIARGATRE
jgi:hypothetical protein